MLALIMKDIASIRKILISTILISLILCVYGIYKSEYIVIPAVCGITPLTLSSAAHGFDARSNFEQMAFSMPIKKSLYILSKLFFPIVFGIIGGVSFFLLFMIEGILPMGIIACISIFTLLTIILISGVQLPFIFKFGEEKGRLVMVITYFILFRFLSSLKGLLANITNLFLSLSHYSLNLIVFFIIALFLIMIILSIKISIVLLEKKEY